ncbi:unnamed protein product [Spirodela intermedia]|uniref:Uncharacterized protein n=1 Tax=Spirodela intermedia TaxID=51605 RepID=A0A7I8JMI2_SPIIN|nr:unnamed protein product [Spirodela intermedia]CAA6671310.1 unnamed protein product [Spirodela intermedia]
MQQHSQQPGIFSSGDVDDDDDDDDDAWSSCSSDEDGEEDRLIPSWEDPGEEDQRVREGYFGDFVEYDGLDGCFDLRWLSELALRGREVVKAWKREEDLSFDAADGGTGGPPLWDLDRGEVIRSFAVDSSPVAAPALVLSAGDSASGCGLEIRVWDARTGGETPAASADLPLGLRRRVLRLGGTGKLLYVGDGAGSSAAVDLRKVRSPVGRVTEDDATWWDADAVVVGGGDLVGFRTDVSRSAPAYRFSPGGSKQPVVASSL